MGKSLVVLAAGMGSRYGGIKQIEGVGPTGETILDYSVFDAVRAGFTRVVFVTRREIEADFREAVGRAIQNHVDVAYVCQSLEEPKVPKAAIARRSKPWGTGHAVLSVAGVVDEPFAVVNADDFYGRTSFEALGTFLGRRSASTGNEHAMVGFKLRNTLSDAGFVSRGICRCGKDGLLASVVEREQIERTGECAQFLDADGSLKPLTGEETVSMNMWGFAPSILTELREMFDRFVRETTGPKAEFQLPAAVNALIDAGRAKVHVLATPDTWCGITYAEDTPWVRAHVGTLVERGVYTSPLWS